MFLRLYISQHLRQVIFFCFKLCGFGSSGFAFFLLCCSTYVDYCRFDLILILTVLYIDVYIDLILFLFVFSICLGVSFLAGSTHLSRCTCHGLGLTYALALLFAIIRSVCWLLHLPAWNIINILLNYCFGF